MPTKTPTQSDFPAHLTISITTPTTAGARPAPNILLLLHGIGDSSAAFSAFGRALNLPETTVITLQAPTRLPFDLPGFHWGDDISFDSRTGALDMDAGFARATRTIVDEVVRGVLVRKCGYRLREIMILGFGQGGMVGLICARELGVRPKVEDVGDDSSATDGRGVAGEMALSGVISIGAPYPISGSVVGDKNRTPVLLVAGRDSEAVSDGAVSRTKGVFEFVEIARYARKGDGMPKAREEMLPVMRFLARRLRSWQGVPEGSVEIS
ncbi:Alpha/Beta hydrolase protein [Aspergillus bertholletiae]|uniref:Alpha/Beta hydrolase protein n=1 Tax=Aspergillus bertholletiae TaxID=1226010 RepID=A0A5N7AYV7_9EURO|nr:Alpha/Beta hydrolase protein [Aspergillus bertholletiae]